MQYVFVPGAWHGSWAWHPVAQRVTAAGHGAVALTMPGLAAGDDPRGLRLADAVDHLVGEVERRDLSDVVLVGHSWGGIPIAGAAPRLGDRLRAVAMVSAFVPRPGESMADALGPDIGAFVRASIAASAEWTIGVDLAAVRESLMPGEPEPLQRLVHDLLLPQPGGYMLDALDEVELTSLGVPLSYLLAERDQALAAPGAQLAARIDAEPLMVPGTHEAILTHPDDVAKALRNATGG